jgi:ATP-dependent protease ClpP protease subunit
MLYGSISDESWFGDEVTPQQFAADLNALGDVKNVTVRINSPGGDVFAALAISSILRDHPASITALIDGYCASAATIITAFADRSQASTNSMFVIHNTSTVAAGDYRVMDKASEILRKANANLIDVYTKKTGIEPAALQEMMDEETWMTGAEAVEQGFIDELVGDNLHDAVKASGSMKNTIQKLVAAITIPPPEHEPVPTPVPEHEPAPALEHTHMPEPNPTPEPDTSEADTLRAEIELLVTI